VSRKTIKDAEFFATIKFLEFLEGKTIEEYQTVNTIFLAATPGWAELFEKKFIRCGGFKRARYLMNPVQFDEQIRKNAKYTKYVAGLIEFSLRFERSEKVSSNRRPDDGY
jgi:hypothetical protein